MACSKEISMADLKEAYKAAAKIVKLYGDIYLPIFQRVHAEIEKRKMDDLLRRLALQAAD